MHPTSLMVMSVISNPEYPNWTLYIQKARPNWQAGRYNLPGGHVEEGESLEEAIRREVKEETGLTLHNPELRLIMVCRYGNVYVYNGVGSGKLRCSDDEPAIWGGSIPLLALDNLYWIVPLVRDNLLQHPIVIPYNLQSPMYAGRAT